MLEQEPLPVGSKVPAIVAQLLAGTKVKKQDVTHLLGLSDESETQYLFSAARRARKQHFNNKIFVYGFLYFSTYCKNDCCFCQYRKTNTSLGRYRKSKRDIVGAAKKMAATGVHLIDLTMGEDPLMFSAGQNELTRFGDIVAAVQSQIVLPLMISPGVLDDESLESFASAGIDWYACYQETHNREHYDTLRTGQSFDTRLSAKRTAKGKGILTEEGLLLGVGESLEDIADSLVFMQSEGYDQVRAMTFVPQKGVTIDSLGGKGSLQERITIAVMRLLMPDRLIPASLDVDGLDGLAGRLDAGANVVTSIVPPDEGLAGVANNSLDIQECRRSLDMILPVLSFCGLEVATQEQYRDWLSKRHMRSDDFASREIAGCV